MRLCEHKNCDEGPGGTKALLDGLRSDARYCCEACRVAEWKRVNGYKDPRRVQTVRNGKSRRSRPPDLRVSYRKAIAAIEAAVPMDEGPYGRLAVEALTSCLTDKQREALCSDG